MNKIGYVIFGIAVGILGMYFAPSQIGIDFSTTPKVTNTLVFSGVLQPKVKLGSLATFQQMGADVLYNASGTNSQFAKVEFVYTGEIVTGNAEQFIYKAVSKNVLSKINAKIIKSKIQLTPMELGFSLGSGIMRYDQKNFVVNAECLDQQCSQDIKQTIESNIGSGKDVFFFGQQATIYPVKVANMDVVFPNGIPYGAIVLSNKERSQLVFPYYNVDQYSFQMTGMKEKISSGIELRNNQWNQGTGITQKVALSNPKNVLLYLPSINGDHFVPALIFETQEVKVSGVYPKFVIIPLY